jgi:hypothetical protein
MKKSLAENIADTRKKLDETLFGSFRNFFRSPTFKKVDKDLKFIAKEGNFDVKNPGDQGDHSWNLQGGSLKSSKIVFVMAEKNNESACHWMHFDQTGENLEEIPQEKTDKALHLLRRHLRRIGLIK